MRVVRDVIRIQPTLSLAAYTGEDQVGNTALEVLAPRGIPWSSLILEHLSVVCNDGSGPDWQLSFWDSLPTTTSVDNDPMNIPSTQASKLVAHLTNDNSFYSTFGANIGIRRMDFTRTPQGLYIGKGDRVWMLPKITSAKTFSTTNAVTFVLGIRAERF